MPTLSVLVIQLLSDPPSDFSKRTQSAFHLSFKSPTTNTVDRYKMPEFYIFAPKLARKILFFRIGGEANASAALLRLHVGVKLTIGAESEIGTGWSLPGRLGGGRRGLGKRHELPNEVRGKAPGWKPVLVHIELERTHLLKCLLDLCGGEELEGVSHKCMSLHRGPVLPVNATAGLP